MLNFKIISILSLFVISLSLLPYADANHIVSFQFSQYNLNDGEPGVSEVIITVNDPTADTTSNPDTVSVTVTSTTDPDGVTLVLTETSGNSGIFQNTNLLFTNGNAKYKISDTVTVSITNSAINNPAVQDTTTVDVRSASGGNITLTLTETGLDTAVFERTLGFTGGTSSGNLLSVVNGDVISIEYLPTNEIFHGLIIPNPNSGINAIATAPGDTITVSYLGDSDTVTMATTGPGSGSGGPVRPSLVVDTVSAGGGDASEHLTRPTFGISHLTNQKVVDFGFAMNGILFEITDNHHTDFPKQEVKTGEENTFTIKTFAPFGLKVVELDIGIPVVGQAHFAESMIEVWLDNDQDVEKVTINQKENLIDKNSVEAQTSKTSCIPLDFEAECLLVEIKVTFLEKPINDIIAIKAIDKRSRFQITYLNEGIDVIGESLNPPKTIQILDRLGYPKIITLIERDVGVDENGDVWFRDGHIWKTEYKIPARDDPVTKHGIDRNNIKFNEYCDKQIIKAQKIFFDIVGGESVVNTEFGKNYNSEILYSQTSRSEDPMLQQQIHDEMIKAEKFFQTKWPEIISNFQNN